MPVWMTVLKMSERDLWNKGDKTSERLRPLPERIRGQGQPLLRVPRPAVAPNTAANMAAEFNSFSDAEEITAATEQQLEREASRCVSKLCYRHLKALESRFMY